VIALDAAADTVVDPHEPGPVSAGDRLFDWQ
jgi:hypothetical protein